MGCFGSKIEYINIETIENVNHFNNKYYVIVKYYDNNEKHLVLSAEKYKKLQSRVKYHKMYYSLVKIKYDNINKITNFQIINKENKDDENINYTFIINYNDDIPASYLKLNKFQLKFFLSMIKINKVKYDVDFIENSLH